jgi:ligand-binding sensor domain-containing protein/serine phosphatase RsbU (regulator of sigma subunit)
LFDRQKRLWVGTDKGIALYDGLSWIQITAKDGLAGTSVIKLMQHTDGSVWAATNDSGINRITIEKHKLNIDKISSKDGLESNFIFDLLQLPNGDVYAAAMGGLEKVAFTNGKAVLELYPRQAELQSNIITSLELDDKNNLWCGTYDAGIIKIANFLHTSSKHQIANYNKDNGFPDFRIWDIYKDHENKLWFATDNSGLVVYDGHFQNISKNNGMTGNQVLRIFEDSFHNLWFGTYGNGLALFNGFNVLHYSENNGIPANIYSIAQMPGGYYLAGGKNSGLIRFSKQNDKLITSKIPDLTLDQTTITTLIPNKNGSVWIGTSDAGAVLWDKKVVLAIDDRNNLPSNQVNAILVDKKGKVYLGTNLGLGIYENGHMFTIGENKGLINSEIQSLAFDDKENLWIATLGGLAYYNGQTYQDFDEEEGLTDVKLNTVVTFKNTVIVVAYSGLYIKTQQKDKISFKRLLSVNDFNCSSFRSAAFINDTVLLLATDNGFSKVYINLNSCTVNRLEVYDKVNGYAGIENNANSILKDANDNIWLGNSKGLSFFNSKINQNSSLGLNIECLKLFNDSIHWSDYGYKISSWQTIPEKFAMSYTNNHLTFSYSAISYQFSDKIRYRYYLEGLESKWLSPTDKQSVTYSSLPDGKYVFHLSSTIDGISWSEDYCYKFVINPPIWKRWWFIILAATAFVCCIILIVKYRERKLIKEKEYLEGVVKERTAEVVSQKEQIEFQHKEITDSIHYAERIQKAIIPSINVVNEYIPNHFILFRPRDIVSGDFYWFGKIDGTLILVAADCTGHGVPGAFMSMLGISLLNKIVNEQKITSPDNILQTLRHDIILSLRQNIDGANKDGMDIAVCALNLNSGNLLFSGANNPLYLCSKGVVNVVKGSKMPAAIHQNMDPFTLHSFQLEPNDRFYLMSDGFEDQFGGPKGKKFMSKQLVASIEETSNSDIKEQSGVIEQKFLAWKGDLEQVDDVLLIGFEYHCLKNE